MRNLLHRRPHSILLLVSGVLVCLLAGASRADNGISDRTSRDEGRAADSRSNGDAAPFQRGIRQRGSNGVYKARLTPNWFPQDAGFWYRNDLPGGTTEYVVVDAAAATRGPAFDHARLAAALKEAAVPDALADRLPISDFELDLQAGHITFRAGGANWQCDLKTYQLSKAEGQAAAADRLAPLAWRGTPRASTRTGAETSLTFLNKSPGPIELFWLDAEGQRHSYGKVSPGGEQAQHTFAGHVWEVVDGDGRTLARFQAAETESTAEITGNPARPVAPPPGPDARRTPRDTSPDGKWIAFLRDHNVFIRPVKGEGDKDEGDREADEHDGEVQLSSDGVESNAYSPPVWSSDSAMLAAFRVEPGEDKLVYLVESSPREGGRARLHQRPYPLPGDKFAAFELNVFDVATAKQIKPDVERIDFGFPRIRFSPDGRTFTYEKVDRGHQRFRLVEVDARTGASRNLIDEKTDTFIWTAHTESADVRRVTWLEKTDEIIYASERDGWRHLYLVDPTTGTIKNQITKGEWVVRGVDRIDEDERKIWFRASGLTAGDPYFIHYCRINFDGTGLIRLTEGDGTHTVQYSPERKFLIDSYSRVDQPPIHVLRRASDGSKVCDLERADIAELVSGGWQTPEVFVAKGRDGQTDIWGIICRPRDFDPAQKYPVIESIYAGPQGSFVPKSFSGDKRFASLTDLGAVVVQIDGMGTANRSKAFHDVCWKNLKDAGLPDRILWHQAVAAKYPWYDISRVGIYGTSAGGQNATSAVLFHPEFYKVAVSACGCHDNRMDKASWNEQWMGYPVGPQYAECSNIDNAYRLQGKLLLIVGEMDNNVPPESTLRLADALIRAEKDFELVVVPGAGHGMGGAFGSRKMHSFFAQHLLGGSAVEPTSPPPAPAVSAVTTTAETTPGSTSPAVTAPPDSVFDGFRERDRAAAREFYKQYVDVRGVPVLAAGSVEPAALVRTHYIVTHLLAGRPDILQAMADNGTRLIVIGKDQVYTDMPEYRHNPNPAYVNERVRGTGGFDVTSFGEENLLNLPLDRYDDESIAVHEFCHTIDAALSRTDATWRDRLRQTFRRAIEGGLWKNAYAASNPAEYWAEICQCYFDCNRINNWNHAAIGTREQLQAYDPQGYELVKSTFRLTRENDWRFAPVRRQPSVIPPPARLQFDPYYTKFTSAREFPVLGSDRASDEALLKANDTIRKMFAYRHDILKALIGEGARLVVLGRGEKLTDLPEFKTSDSADASLRFADFTPERKVIVVPEENLLGLADDPSAGKPLIIGAFARAAYRVAAQRPVDPEFNKRRDRQQYELRVKRLDIEFDRRLATLFDEATKRGLWKDTPADRDRIEYLVAGVEAYFDTAGNTLVPTGVEHPIRTREALQSYDPGLFALVEELMAYKDHADWRYQ